MPHIERINVNPRGGVPKFRVVEAIITTDGVSGDKQLDLRFHGGPERAVSLYSHEHILALQAEGHPIDCGTTGENLTVAGLDWTLLQSGDRIQIGQEVCLELTAPAAPCKTIIDSFLDGRFIRMSEKAHPGWSRWYSRVLITGKVKEGDSAILHSR